MSEIGGPLDDGGISVRDDPFALFEGWFEEAKKSEDNEPNAMALATADAQGRPNVRMVLLKEATPNGFVFYTNYESAKVSEAESDVYFATRAKDSQIGAWASAQSRPMQGRFAFEKEVAKYAAKY